MADLFIKSVEMKIGDEIIAKFDRQSIHETYAKNIRPGHVITTPNIELCVENIFKTGDQFCFIGLDRNSNNIIMRKFLPNEKITIKSLFPPEPIYPV